MDYRSWHHQIYSRITQLDCIQFCCGVTSTQRTGHHTRKTCTSSCTSCVFRDQYYAVFIVESTELTGVLIYNHRSILMNNCHFYILSLGPPSEQRLLYASFLYNHSQTTWYFINIDWKWNECSRQDCCGICRCNECTLLYPWTRLNEIGVAIYPIFAPRNIFSRSWVFDFIFFLRARMPTKNSICNLQRIITIQHPCMWSR